MQLYIRLAGGGGTNEVQFCALSDMQAFTLASEGIYS